VFLYRPEISFTPTKRLKSRKVLVVGKTGDGKTTLINSFINHHFDIKYDDDFKYVLNDEKKVKVNESQSQTSEVIDFEIDSYGDKPSIIIIDSPGFGDTRGLQYDEEIVNMI
jgi:GTPase SAR1 family protein